MIRCKKCAVGLLGACGLDYCQQEREVLIEQAQQAAEERGHTLSSFEKIKDYPIWQATCSQCGQMAAINLDPPAGEPDVYGDAVSGVCPKAEVSETEVSTEKTSEENTWCDDLANSEKQ
jgi:hypothetical protein